MVFKMVIEWTNIANLIANKVVDKNEKKSCKKYVIFENNTNKMIKQYKNGKELLYHNINNIKM